MTLEIKMHRSKRTVRVNLPTEMIDRLHAEGDRLYAVETDKGILLTTQDPNFEEAMKIYHRGAKKYKNAMRELA